jgi:uncharacterized protein
MLATGMTMAKATASTLLSVALFGAATSANYTLSGLVDGRLAGLLLLGGVIGGLLGLALAKLLSARALLARRRFAGLIVVVAGYVDFGAVGGA